MEVAGEPVGGIVKLATGLGGGVAETEKVGELQPDDPKTNRRASRATYVFRQGPLSRPPCSFVGPVLKGRNGSTRLVRQAVSERPLIAHLRRFERCLDSVESRCGAVTLG